VCNAVVEDGKIPEDWSKSRVASVQGNVACTGALNVATSIGGH